MYTGGVSLIHPGVITIPRPPEGFDVRPSKTEHETISEKGVAEGHPSPYPMSDVLSLSYGSHAHLMKEKGSTHLLWLSLLQGE